MKEILKEREKGITLIVLVLTIIVLLILAGVGIAMLTGDNGIITNSNEESGKTTVQGSNGTDEKINVVGNDIETGGKVSEGGTQIGGLEEYQTEDTKPYLPGNEFKQVEGTNLENGLVVTDGTNYWTWIEVPITDVFKTAKAEDEYDKIEDDLEAYTGDLVDREGYTDQWYDCYGASYDENSGYGQVNTFPNNSKFNEAKGYYGAIYTDSTGTTEATSLESSSTKYYVKMDENKLEYDGGCGLAYKEYNDLKKYMLSSLYKNGGFWIGQYEGGYEADSYLADVSENDTRTLVIKQGAYPYNYITCADAQKKSSELNSGDYKSSLMFGIQWDLVIKHLQVRGEMTQAELTSDSKNWGNYCDSTFTIENGKYARVPYTKNSFKDYTEPTSGYVENSTKNKSLLLTTGANSSKNMKMNIYDLAGNVEEGTLEKSTFPYYPCATRGGEFRDFGTRTASYHFLNSTTASKDSYGFRSALY